MRYDLFGSKLNARGLMLFREAVVDESTPAAGGTATVVEEGLEAPVTVLTKAASDAPARTSKPEERDKDNSRMTPAQKLEAEKYIESMRARVTGFQTVRQAEGREIHAHIVRDGAALLKLIADADGERTAMQSLRKVWDPFLDVRSTPEAHAVSAVVYQGRTEEVKARANRGYRQYFTMWDLLIRAEAGLYREGENIPQSTIRLHGRDYAKPSEALEGGNTLTDVFQTWSNIVRPVIDILDEYPTKRAVKQIFEDAAKAVSKIGVVTRRKIKFKEDGQDRERWQKVKLTVVPAKRGGKPTALPPAGFLGLFAGLILEAHRQGVIKQEITGPDGAKLSFVDALRREIEQPSLMALATVNKDDDDTDEDEE